MTDFTFKCPACDQPMISEIENAGRQIECPDCGATITLPNPPGDPDATPPAILDSEGEAEKTSVEVAEEPDDVEMEPIPLTGGPATETDSKAPEKPNFEETEEDKLEIPPTPEEPPLSPSNSEEVDEEEDAASNLKLQD